MKTVLKIVLFVTALLTSCVSSPTRVSPQRTNPLTVVYLANRNGEVEPCGCQVNQIGGLHRLEAFLNELRTQSKVDFIGDAGDTFFMAAKLNPFRVEEAKLKAKLIAKSYAVMGVDAVTPGERDFALGIDFLRELVALSGSHFLSVNLADVQEKLLFPAFHVFEKSGTRIGVIGISDEEAFQNVPGVKVLPSKPRLIQAIRELQDLAVERIILLSHSGLTRDRDLATVSGIDLIFGSHSLDVVSSPGGNPWILQPLNDGQQVGVIRFSADGKEREHRLVDLGKQYDGENQTNSLMKAYREAIRLLGVEKLNSSVAIGESSEPFLANPSECRTCHQKQYDFWAKTKHATAYLVLFAKNQHFDPECVACHTLGFEDPRGFSEIANPLQVAGKKKGFVESFMKTVFRTDSKKPLDSREEPKRYEKLKRIYHKELGKLENSAKVMKNFLGVQCEHCHGNRNGHPGQAMTLKKVQESSCKSCHVPPHAKPYDPTKLEKVSCPLSMTAS